MIVQYGAARRGRGFKTFYVMRVLKYDDGVSDVYSCGRNCSKLLLLARRKLSSCINRERMVLEVIITKLFVCTPNIVGI